MHFIFHDLFNIRQERLRLTVTYYLLKELKIRASALT